MVRRLCINVVALVAAVCGSPPVAAGDEAKDPSAMNGPYGLPFADTCAALRVADPAGTCQRAFAGRLGDRDVELYRVTSGEHVALFVALRERRGWYVSPEPIEWWVRTTSLMTGATSRSRVTAIDARPARVSGVAAVAVLVRTAWTRDCGDDCDDGHASFTSVAAMVCGTGRSGQPSCTEPIDVRGFDPGGPEVRVEHDAWVVRGSDLEDGTRSIDLP